MNIQKDNVRLYTIWANIKQRCNNPKNTNYIYYGGREICCCDEWLDFMNFKLWADKNGYSEALTIDRIDVNGDYEPSNCRRVTMQEQSLNRRKRSSKRVERNIELLPSGKFRVQIVRNGKKTHIGCYGTLPIAISERNKWEEKWRTKNVTI